jgi:Calcineurin-like phosphoesterase
MKKIIPILILGMVLLCGFEASHFLTNIRDTNVHASRVTLTNFTIIVLPDTQEYATSYPEIFTNQTQWIVSHKDAFNIVYVTNEGDITNVGSSREFKRANTSYSLLENPKTTHLPYGIPYTIIQGNHDHATNLFNKYFSYTRFAGRSYYGGHYSTNNNNNYVLFNASDMSFIAIGLDYNPTTAELNWANGLLKTYSNRRAVVVTHCILNDVDASWEGNGQTIYNTLKDNPNLFLMLCGHMHGENRRTETHNSHTMNILLADYQTRTNGGNGYLRIMTFCPAINQIKVKTYSTYINRYETDANSQFNLTYDMNQSGQQIPTNKKKTPGFELIIIIDAIALVTFWKRKKRYGN